MDLNMIPFSWKEPERSKAGDHDVTSALEIAGNEVSFPRTGATVRAVPILKNGTNGTATNGSTAGIGNGSAHQSTMGVGDDILSNLIGGKKAIAEAVSRPGDTYWKGAVGAAPAAPTPPPDITMICLDEQIETADPFELVLSWDMSWSDVLDILRHEFGRACVLSYEGRDKKGKPTRVDVASEGEFDSFCSWAETRGFRCEVLVRSATFMPSEFISAPLEEQFPMHPYVKKKNEPVDEEALLVKEALRLQNGEDNDSGDEDEKLMIQAGDEPSRGQTFWERIEDSPYPWSHMIVIGGLGLFGSLAAVIYGYMTNLNSLAAITLALPVNIFVMSFFVPAVEDGFPSLLRLGIGFTGFFAAIACVVCHSISYELISLAACFVWLLASFWYLEITTKARGWPSWYTGLMNIIEWAAGGCVLPGIRTSEPVERIMVMGNPPFPTVFTVLQSEEERHPGCDWERMEPAWKEAVAKQERIKCMHVGQLLQTLSERGNPMGVFEEGIIDKRLARQLRKWLIRNGKKTESDMKRYKGFGVGEVLYYGPLGTQVRWSGTGDSSYHKTGEGGVYELVRYIEDEEEKVAPGVYKDGSRMHGGGSDLTAIQTFIKYFMLRFCAFLWYWIAFFSYILMLYTLTYTITFGAVTNAMGGNAYKPRGFFYPAQPGGGTYLHIFCKGYTETAPNGKPPVIIESMEGIGTGISMARIQDEIAKNGIACVYDRAGFGYSSNLEVQTGVWNNRTPNEIAREIHYALKNGRDRQYQRPVGWIRNVLDNATNTTQEQYIPIKGPFVMMGVSAGTLYTRQFANNYPADTAGMILIDPAPTANGGLQTAQQRYLDPFTMTLCTRFLQPTGVIRALYPTLIEGLFAAKTKFEMNGGDKKDKDDYERMTATMYARNWCPSVLAEHNGLFSGSPSGIDTVAAADKAGYGMPTVIWARSTNRLEGGVSSSLPAYDYNPNATKRRVGESGYDQEVGLGALSGLLLGGLGLQEGSWGKGEDEALSVSAGRETWGDWWDPDTGSGSRSWTSQRRATRLVSWLEIQKSLLKSLRDPWLDPFTLEPGIMQGDPASCLSRECSEYTAMENAVEHAGAVKDVWLLLGYKDLDPGNKFTLTLGMGLSEFNATQFKRDLSFVLRHVAAQDIEIVEDPVAGAVSRRSRLSYDYGGGEQSGWGEENLSVGGGSDERRQSSYVPGPQCGNWGRFPGYSGSQCGDPVYTPIRNFGSIVLSLRMYAHKKRSVTWSEQNLRGNEDISVDRTAVNRRTKFIRQWRVLNASEYSCVNQTSGAALCDTEAIDIFSILYSDPAYECPQNTYRSGITCAVCGLEEASPTGSTSKSQCRTCDSTPKEGGGFTYTYLSCDGRQCNECPPGTLSSRGALNLGDCVPVPKLTMLLKGPLGPATVSRGIEGPQPTQSAFNFERLKIVIGNITGLSPDRLIFDAPVEEQNYDDGRCYQQKGICLVRIAFVALASSKAQLEAATSYISGTECTVYDPVNCPKPDVNRTRREARLVLIKEFDVVQIFQAAVKGVDSGECPNRWILAGEDRTVIPHIISSFSDPPPVCPTGTYSTAENICEMCPDMTASDKGSTSITACAPFLSLILVGKDASLTYQARTEATLGGIGNAQPNAVDIYGLSLKNASYIKVRGYAIQPDSLVNVYNPSQGYQADRCNAFGLNCFNQTEFRYRLSQAAGSLVSPNQVRLLYPRNCDPFTAGLSADQYPTLPPSVKMERICGPFPGIAPLPGSTPCVCGLDGIGGTGCFWSSGVGTIGKDIGSAIASAQLPTTADCAASALSNSGVNAFIYHPDTKTCLHRAVEEGSGGTFVCHSSSKVCREFAEFTTNNAKILQPGATMYWRDRGSVCPIPNDADTASFPGLVSEMGLACSASAESDHRVFKAAQTGTPQPLDTFHVIVTLHGSTATAVKGAYDRITGAVQSQARADLMRDYSIIQVLLSTDKTPTGTRSSEYNLQTANRVNPQYPTSSECNPRCVTGQPQCLAVSGVKDSNRPIPRCSGASRSGVCNELYTPQCVLADGSLGGAVSCPCADALDSDIDSTNTVMPFVPGDNLTVYVARDAAKGDGTLAAVTKIEIAQGKGPNWIEMVQLTFSDGSVQYIKLAANNLRQVIYILPVVTTSVTVSLGPAETAKQGVGISHFQITGQILEDTYRLATPVNLFAPGFISPPAAAAVAAQSTPAVTCPATTYAASGAGTAAGCCTGDKCSGLVPHDCMCRPCPYPLISPAGASGIEECVCPSCGDGMLHWQADEQCDDNNTATLDGCNTVCVVEQLQMCQGPSSALGVGYPLQSYTTKDTCLMMGSYWNSYGVADFTKRQGARAAVHNKALWVVGGAGDKFQTFSNDAWFEDTNGWSCVPTERDGVCPASSLTWGIANPLTLAPNASAYTPLSTFPPRAFHGLVSFQGFLWVIGGLERVGWQQTLSDSNPTATRSCEKIGASTWSCLPDRTYGDVWRTSGTPASGTTRIQWELVEPTAGTDSWASRGGGRGYHATLVFKGKIYIIGGATITYQASGTQTISYNDVWSSSDGRTWTEVVRNAEWTARMGLAATVDPTNTKIFIMGGMLPGTLTYMNDVWSSPDGQVWTLVVAHASWGGRWLHTAISFQGNMWVVGGMKCGVERVDKEGTQEFSATAPGSNPCNEVNQNPGTYYSDVWVDRDDGVAWDRSTGQAGWSGRGGHVLVSWDTANQIPPLPVPRNNLYVIGGAGEYDSTMQDVWIGFEF